jgi:hypothetical protein
MTDKEEAIREEEEEENKEAETDTMDIYKEKELEEMLENDEITEAEYSFMLGREKRKKKLGLKEKEHEDTKSVDLAKEEYLDD